MIADYFRSGSGSTGKVEHIMGLWIPVVARLPRIIRQIDPTGGVWRPWTRVQPLRYQGVLATAIRGCDISEKEDPAKDLNRMIRRACLNPADERETTVSGGFFGFEPDRLISSTKKLLHSLDHYPLHYVGHLTHACEVIGYLGLKNTTQESECSNLPSLVMGQFFSSVYFDICYTLHMNPETPEQLRERMTMDRWEAGTTERNF
jgi:hypothetical protein